jgi:hypothetical protein
VRNQNLIDIEKELDRLWVGHQQVAVVKLGKDKFALADGRLSVRAKGFQILRVTKKMPDRVGLDRFWKTMKATLVTCKK